MYNCYFSCQTFRENRNLWRCCEFKYLTLIFRHLTVYLDLKDFLELKEFKDLGLKDLKLRKLLNLIFLNIQSISKAYPKEDPKKFLNKIPRRYKMMHNCRFLCQTLRFFRNVWRYCEFKYLYANLWTFDCSSWTFKVDLQEDPDKIQDDVQLLFFFVSNISKKSKSLEMLRIQIFLRESLDIRLFILNLKNLRILNLGNSWTFEEEPKKISKKILRRYKMMYNCYFFVSTILRKSKSLDMLWIRISLREYLDIRLLVMILRVFLNLRKFKDLGLKDLKFRKLSNLTFLNIQRRSQEGPEKIQDDV
jgi:hypothetical protein